MQHVREAGLADHIHLLGELRDVAGVLTALDVCVSSSIAVEAFSNSVGEAMSCALPCVVTDVGDSPAVVGDTGAVVPAGDTAALAAAMIAMHDLGSAGRAAWGERARRRVLGEFDIEGVAVRYAGLYETLVARATKAH
jgi:glycosyltransferase involved in cell wall biosynthesis